MRCQTTAGPCRGLASVITCAAQPPCASTTSGCSSRTRRRSCHALVTSAIGSIATRRMSAGSAVSDPAVERGAAREHDVHVARRVQCRREIERHELCTAALAAADEVQDAHRLHRAMPRPWHAARG